jgi:GNAT superfamily N-acetyltransferase
LLGREGLVLNVYVERAWRRRGVARRLMQEIFAWASEAGIVRIVLHASADGRALYEALGFVDTNEMRYTGRLAPHGPVLGVV